MNELRNAFSISDEPPFGSESKMPRIADGHLLRIGLAGLAIRDVAGGEVHVIRFRPCRRDPSPGLELGANYSERRQMQRSSSGDNHTSYKIGALTMTSLRDGYVDMPSTRLRQPGNKVFGDDLPQQVRLVDGNLRLSVICA